MTERDCEKQKTKTKTKPSNLLADGTWGSQDENSNKVVAEILN